MDGPIGQIRAQNEDIPLDPVQQERKAARGCQEGVVFYLLTREGDGKHGHDGVTYLLKRKTEADTTIEDGHLLAGL